MKELIKLASIEAFNSNESAGRFVSGISDNLHDILMYLSANKDNLPNKSEVSVNELFQLLNKSIEDMGSADSHINNSKKWLSSMTTSD